MFSSRTNWLLTPNRLSQLLRERRERKLPILDLTESNPTRCVLEDGVLQTISDFSLEDVEKLAQVTGGEEHAQVIDLAKLRPRSTPTRCSRIIACWFCFLT